MNKFAVRSRLARAFTLVELFIVVSILAIAVALGVPTFGSMLDATSRTLARNALQEAVSQARFLATAFGRDSAAVFVTDPGGTVRIVPMLLVGEFEEVPGDPFGSGGNVPDDASFVGLFAPLGAAREVFAPVPDTPGFTLPEGWAVRGYVQAGRLQPVNPLLNTDPEWYDSPLYGGNNPTAQAKSEANWVAPEDVYFNPYSPGGAVNASGFGGLSTPRQTFMVRFEGGTGLLRIDTAPAVTISPRPSTRNSESVSDRALRIDLAEDLGDWASQVMTASLEQFRGNPRVDPVELAARRDRLIGVYSNETVLAGPVTRLALYREARLAEALESRDVNALTGTLYAPPGKQLDLDQFAAPTEQLEIRMDVELENAIDGVRYPDGILADWAGDIDALRVSINQWMEGDSDARLRSTWQPPDLIGDGISNGELDDGPEAVFIIDSLSGDLIAVRGGDES